MFTHAVPVGAGPTGLCGRRFGPLLRNLAEFMLASLTEYDPSTLATLLRHRTGAAIDWRLHALAGAPVLRRLRPPDGANGRTARHSERPARYSGGWVLDQIKLQRSNDAEVALLVSDAWQGQGIGSELLRWLIQVGRDEGVERIVGDVLADNQVMLRILPRFGFQLHRSMAEPVRVMLTL